MLICIQNIKTDNNQIGLNLWLQTICEIRYSVFNMNSVFDCRTEFVINCRLQFGFWPLNNLVWRPILLLLVQMFVIIVIVGTNVSLTGNQGWE